MRVVQRKETDVGQLLDVTDSTFETEVVNSTTPVLVDFWAPWCGPCKAIGPVLGEIAEARGDSLKIVKVNIDENQQMAQKLGVMSIPTMVFFKDGQPVDKIVGAHPKGNIEARIDKNFAVAAAS
jgi:thioredoxin 1